ncbi:MAG: signal peptidase I [Clostridia bacterium]|jgi:signal peptidase I|nr:signal peptidase I [Clostridia bacterium]MBR2605511.1 signal peptidase I [Clostridia bacterium]
MLTNKDKKRMQRMVAQRNERLKGGRFWDIMEYLITLLLMMVLAFSIRAVIFEPMRVKGSSMKDTLQPGDYMAVEKLSYIVTPMKRGDVVICYYPNNDEYTCVKRIIGLAGDTITIEGGVVSVNGVRLQEDYVTTGMTPKHDGTYEVEEGCIFVMGDNRLVSRDSTDGMVGNIPAERVIGRVRRVLLPFSRAKKLGDIRYDI